MEGRVTEYKRELTSGLDGLEREVVSFLNSSGGELIIGIADDGSVCGIENVDDTVKVVFRYASGIEDQSAKRTDDQSAKRTVRQSMKIASKEAVKAEILSYLRSNPTASYQEISESAGVVRSTAGKYVKELVESGLLMRSGNNRSGYWKVL